MRQHLLRVVFLVSLLAGTLGVAASASAVDTPFSVRYAQTLRGSIDAVGNQLLTCPAATAGCTNARDRIGTATTLNNNNYNMAYVDVDGDASTLNSSTSTLSLPAGAVVTWAGLYWGADTAAGTGNVAAPDAANRGSVRFKVDSGGYQTVSAAPADLLTSTGNATRYRAFADVTALLPAAGNATYTVANVQTGRGADRYAGWSLVVAYQDAAQDMHRVSVYDGLGTVDATHTFSTDITPFYTPATGTVATKTGLLAFEGDAGLVGETATFNGTALTDAINGPGNLMNSTMAVDGTLFTAKNPNYGNLMGTDIDVWNKTGFLANHQSSAALAFTSNQDLFVPSALWLVSDEGPAANATGPTVGGIARDGSTLTANPGTWNGTPTITYEYQWQRCDTAGANCVDIPGETGSTYTLTPADVGRTIRVLVTAVNDAGSSSPATSTPSGTVAQLAPSNLTLPQLSGVDRDGQTLTTTLGGWNGTAPLAYDLQWQRCDALGASCADIAGATAWSYVLTGADVDMTVRSVVTASNNAGSSSASSAPTTTVDPDPPANTTLPAVSGVARDGQVLTAAHGAWTGTAPIAYTYQWRRCDAAGASCTDIAGATASTYTLTSADVDGSVRVQVTATNIAGGATATSAATAAVIATPPTNTVAPTLSGTPSDGNTLTLDPGTWTGTTPMDFDVVWQRCDSGGANCVAIPGETGNSYTLTPADLDATIRVLVTASNGVGVAGATTTPTAPIVTTAPANTVLPVVSGNRVDAETLTADQGTWTGTQPIAYSYQWQRCDQLGDNCNNLAGATNPSFTLSVDDIGTIIRVVVTAANAAGASAAVSSTGIPIAPAPPVSHVAPTTTGSAASGQMLTAHDGTWTGSQPLDATYQWERCDADGTGCAAIAGATGPNYTLTDDDAGHTVRVEVTYTNAAGSDAAASAPTAVVQGNPPAAGATAPSLSGTARDGQTLTLDDGDWTGTPTITHGHQWQRCDSAGANCTDIAGATGPTYDLQGADVGHTVQAVVTATNAYGDAAATTVASAVVVGVPPAVTIAPAVIGTAIDGQTLTADPGIWSGTAPVTYAYQWQRCDLDGTNCADIAGATADTYTLTSADADHGIVVEVTAANAAGTATGVSPLAAVNAVAPQSTMPPAVTGTDVDGQTLTAGDGSWSGTTPLTLDHQWLRCDADGTNCQLIAGATGGTYTLTSDDIGHQVLVAVHASNSAGAAQAVSAPAAGGPVAADAPQSTTPPLVTGATQDGATLAAGTGGWTGTEPLTFTYQWQRCDAAGASCADIPGATGSTYTLTAADVAGTVRAIVTATNAAGDDTSTSDPSGTVAATPPVSTTLPAVAGTPVDGQTLTADHGGFSGTGPMTYDYQWQRCDADGTGCTDIAGATGATYDLVSADVGGAIVVVVTATNAADTATVASAATGEVLALAPANVSAPTITGDPLDGHTLTADPGTWSGTTPMTYTYAWQRCDTDGSNCAAILAAGDPTYTLTPDDIGHVITVVVTATNVGGSVPTAAAPTAAAQADPPANTVVPAVSGTPQDGSTLTADTGTWTGTSPILYTYEWQRCDADGANCAAIPGATGPAYDLTPADVGHAVAVVVTGTNAGGTDVATSLPSSSVAIDPPASSGTPAATGTPVDGQTLTADPGAWTGTGVIEFTYQWQRCDTAGANCADVPGATGSTYTLGTGDLGSTVRVVVTGDNGEQTSIPSAAVGPAAPLPPASTGVPVISGTVGAGHTVSAGDGTWDGSLPLTFTYQWERCDAAGGNCADIAGATGSSYDLVAADVGHAIRVAVTASNSAGDDDAVSAPTAPTLPSPPVNTTQPPAPTGTPVDGGTLTAGDGAWTGDGPITFTHQWQRCADDGTACTDISGATADTYSPTGADVDHVIVVVVTATNPGGSSTRTSAPTAGPVAAPPVNTVPPSVTGTPADGGTLTADPGTWTGTGPLTHEYQWQRCDADGTNCADIPGATAGTYSPTAADVGHPIVVVVTTTNSGASTTQASEPSEPTLPAPPVNTTQPPAPTGTAVDGGALTADTGAWSGDGPIGYTYQWQRCDADGTNCTDISGATDDTYSPAGADVGHAIVVEVTATNPGGSSTQASAPTGSPIAAAPPANTTAPSITGTPADGGTLTADPGTWTGTLPIDYSYQWQRCDADGTNCTDIAGAADHTYSPTAADIGSAITVVVTAANAVTEVSEPAATATGPVVASPPHDTVAPVVSGTVAPGGTLTAGDGTWTGTAPVVYTYQWQRCDEDGRNCVDVAGATDATYTLGQGDQGHTIVVVVTATNDAGHDTSTSAPSALLAAPPANTVAPAITGDDHAGGTLTADPGTWTGTGPLTYAYQWQRCDADGTHCVDIPGATNDTYVLAGGDTGSVIAVVVTASNAAGDVAAPAPATAPIAQAATPTPTPTPTATPTPTPTATPHAPGAGSHPPSGTVVARPTPPTGAADSLMGVLGDVPGSLVSDASCQQLAGNAKYSRLKLRGIGTVRVRAYTQGPATKLTPILVTTQISHARTKKVTVRYTLDGRTVKVGRKPRYKGSITPSLLQRIGVHKLVATVTRKGKAKGGKKRAKPIVLKLKTVSCRTLFTAQRWRTTAGFGLRLRIDARTALDRISFKVPAALLPRQKAKKRTIGFMRVFVAGQSQRKRYALKLAKKGRGKLMLSGQPVVRSVRGGLEVRDLPAGSAVAELTLYRVKKLDGATGRKRYRLKARVMRPGAAALSLSVRPRAPR